MLCLFSALSCRVGAVQIAITLLFCCHEGSKQVRHDQAWQFHKRRLTTLSTLMAWSVMGEIIINSTGNLLGSPCFAMNRFTSRGTVKHSDKNSITVSQATITFHLIKPYQSFHWTYLQDIHNTYTTNPGTRSLTWDLINYNHIRHIAHSQDTGSNSLVSLSKELQN